VGYFPRLLPDLPLVAYWAQGLLAALLRFGTVFLHELSHAVAARSYGLPASGITLCVIAGLVAAFYGVVIGVTQKNPRTVLAYSSIS
jgi:Zn-dependent protease